jgi:hypothetical protein
MTKKICSGIYFTVVGDWKRVLAKMIECCVTTRTSSSTAEEDEGRGGH